MGKRDRTCCCCIPLQYGVVLICLASIFELICVATILRLDARGNRVVSGVNTYNLLARIIICTLFFILCINAKNKISRGVLYYSYTLMTVIDFIMFLTFTVISFVNGWQRKMCMAFAETPGSSFSAEWENLDNCTEDM